MASRIGLETLGKYLFPRLQLRVGHWVLAVTLLGACAAAGLTGIGHSISCGARRVVGAAKVCVPGDERQFDAFGGGRTLVELLCNKGYTDLKYVRASGFWLNGRLDATASGAKAEYLVGKANGDVCRVLVDSAMAERIEPGRSSPADGKPWPVCSSADTWQGAKALGYRFPKRVDLAYDYQGLQLTLHDGQYGEWTLGVDNACPRDWRNFSSDVRPFRPSGLANEISARGESGKQPRAMRGMTMAEARLGCRSPAASGCAECCLPRSDGCDRFSWRPGDSAPIYELIDRQDSRCPSKCSRCATCSEYDERHLRTFAPRPECDCQTPFGLADVCFDINSCACFCKQVTSLVAACPGLLE